jgi:NTE family protein
MAQQVGRKHAEPKLINLAIQGGGSHGAFAWGAIDRLLEDGRVSPEGIVGTSAGAMNAVITAYGLVQGGNEGARAALRRFWTAVSEKGAYSVLRPSWLDRWINPGSMDYSPAWLMMDLLSRMMSPYQTNLSNYNPLREILTDQIDFEQLRRASSVKLFTSASNVTTNRLRVFERSEMTVDTVLASACLPTVFQAIEIDGAYYWDGGYMGNPPIFPLIYNCHSPDVVLIMINPIQTDEVPRSAQTIMDRINTLSFNSSLMREMRAIAFVTRMIDRGFNDEGRLKRVFMHCIDAEQELRSLGVSSKVNVEWSFLTRMFELGRRKADAFLRDHFDKLGNQSSVDIEQRFL